MYEMSVDNEEKLQELLKVIAKTEHDMDLDKITMDPDFIDDSYYGDVLNAIGEYFEYLKGKYGDKEICHECGFIDCQCAK